MKQQENYSSIYLNHYVCQAGLCDTLHLNTFQLIWLVLCEYQTQSKFYKKKLFSYLNQTHSSELYIAGVLRHCIAISCQVPVFEKWPTFHSANRKYKFITSQRLDYTTGKVKTRDAAKCDVPVSEAYGSEKKIKSCCGFSLFVSHCYHY